MQCVILAGGLGVRMKAFTENLPKNLVPVQGVPFARLQLDWLARHGVSDVVYSIGYRGDQIRDFVQDGSRWGLAVSYVEDGAIPLGTGGPLRKACDLGLLSDWFLLLYGDSFLPIDFRAFGTAFLAQDLPAMMGVYRNEGRWDTGNVLLSGGRVELYEKNSGREMPYIDYGLTALRRSLVRERIPAGAAFQVEGLYHDLSRETLLAAYEVTQRFYEIGSPTGLSDLEAWLAGPGRSWIAP